jgi:glyoxylase-like metal-dependent hydrolase (beta-lactamase superfamily II)
MQELAPGLWHWSAPHAEWTPEQGGDEGWPQEVSSYALDDGERLVLIDPVAPPSLFDELAEGRRPAVVLTCPWHDRDSAALVERLGVQVHAPRRVPGHPQVAGPVFAAGDTAPGGIEILAAIEDNDLVLWIPAQRALVFGDTLIDRGDGHGLVIPETWTPVDMPRAARAAVLHPLLDLPVELVLPTHGQPTDRASLERALS